MCIALHTFGVRIMGNLTIEGMDVKQYLYKFVLEKYWKQSY